VAARQNNLDFGSERERPVSEIPSAPSELAACRGDAAPQRARLCPYTAVISSTALTTLSWPRWSPARTTEWRNSARINCWAVPIRAEVVAIPPWKCGWARAASIEHQPRHFTDPPFTSKPEPGASLIMASHKFKAGQTVAVAPRRYDPKIGGSFKVVRILPAERGNNQYRIRSVLDGHERVVMEGEIGSG